MCASPGDDLGRAPPAVIILTLPSLHPPRHQYQDGWRGHGKSEPAAGIDSSLPLETGSNRKLKSGWLAERERVMAEWGAFALSGLVLSD